MKIILRLLLIGIMFLLFVSVNLNQEKGNSFINNFAESYSGIKTSTVKYLSGKDTVSGFLASPVDKGEHPALIVIHEWWGLTPWVKNNAEDFAKKGYVALAVDLYRGKVTSDPEVAHELSRELPEDRAERDLKAAFSYLSSLTEVNKEKIGSIGWCFGGGYSLQTALMIPKLNACVINYGRLVTEKNSIDKINCPVLGIFGEQDRGIPPKSVKEFEDAMKKEGKNIKIVIYPKVGHAFMNPDNKGGYNKNAAGKAWLEIYSFLDKTLMK